MENDSLNESLELEEKLETSKNSIQDEAKVTSPRAPYALHNNCGDKRIEKGDAQPKLPITSNTVHNKQTTKKINSPTESISSSHVVRAPYAQPILDASKIQNGDGKKSSIEERLASARERRLQQQKQLEQEALTRRDREDLARNKWLQAQDERKKKIEENKLKDDAHRKEVEMRKKQQMEEEKKKAEAKIARSEQIYEVKLRQKRSTSNDRGVKRWSWGGAGVGGAGAGGGGGDIFHYFDPTRMTKRIPSASATLTTLVYPDKRRQRPLHASAYDLSMIGYHDGDGEHNTSGSRSSLVSPSTTKQPPRLGEERFSKSPLLMNTTHLAFASGLRSYDSSPSSVVGRGISPAKSPDVKLRRSHSLGSRRKKTSTAGGPLTHTASVENLTKPKDASGSAPPKQVIARGRSPTPKVTLSSMKDIRQKLSKNKLMSSPKEHGRPATASGLTEPCVISPRLLAPTRSSLARSRNALHDLDDNASQSSTTSSTNISSQHHGPIRSRSKDRRGMATKSESEKSSPRSESIKAQPPKPTPERKSTPVGSRGSSPMLPARRPPSPVLSKSMDATGAENKKKSAPMDLDKSLQRGISPQTRPRRAPSPFSKSKRESSASQSSGSESQTSLRAKRAPSPAARSKTKTSSDQPRNTSTPPNIKPSLRSATGQVKSRASPIPSKPDTSKSNKTKMKEAAKQKPVKEDSKESKKEENVDAGKSPPGGLTASSSTGLPQSLSNTSQAVSDIPTSSSEVQEPEKIDVRESADVVQVSADAEVPKQEESEVEVEVADIEIAPAVEEVTSIQNEKDTVKEESKAKENDNLEQEEDSASKDEDVLQPEMLEQAVEQKQEEEDVVIGHAEESKEPLYPTVQETAVVASSPDDSLDEDEEDVPQHREVDSSLQEELAAAENLQDSQEVSQSSTVSENETCPPAAEMQVSLNANIEVEQDTAKDEGKEELKDGAGDETKEITNKDDTEDVAVSEQTTDEEVSDVEKARKDSVKTEIKLEERCEKEEVVSEKNDVVEPGRDGNADVKEASAKEENESSAPAEKKKEPRKLTSEEEAYRQALAEKRREAKEKREREEREKKERMRLAKIEQAKREEEARMMFEEAAAKEAEEEERRQEQEKLRIQQEEEEKRLQVEKKQEEENRRREATEKLKKERELQAQKQDDERLARKKRLQMIMRRTRDPDSEANKTNTPSTTPPQTESPVGGQSPLISVTPERSVSPAVVEALQERSVDVSESMENKEPSVENVSQNTAGVNEQNTNISNSIVTSQNSLMTSSESYDGSALSHSEVELIRIGDNVTTNDAVDMPEPFEAFATIKSTVVNDSISNDIKNQNFNIMDSFYPPGQHHHHSASVNGSDDLLNMNSDMISQKIAKEPLVQTGI